MRLLYVVEDFEPTFVSTNVGTLVALARDEGWEVDVLTTTNAINRDLEEFGPGVPLIKLATARAILRYLLRHGRRYGMVVSYNTRRHNIVLPWLRVAHGVRSVIKLDRHVGWTRGSLRATARAHLVVRLPAERAHAVLVETPEVERELLEVAPRARTVRFPNCVPDHIEAYRHASLGTPREEIILYVGRLSPEKGVDVLVEAFARIADKHPAWRLVLVGPPRDAAYVEGLRAAVRSAGLEARVDLVGELYGDPLHAHFVRAGVFCLPSRREGMSNVLTEAMAFGTPIVATRVGAADYQLDGGAGGFLVKPGDAGALAEGLDRMLNDAALRTELGQRARARAEGEFLLRAHQKTLREVFALHGGMER